MPPPPRMRDHRCAFAWAKGGRFQEEWGRSKGLQEKVEGNKRLFFFKKKVFIVENLKSYRKF